MQVIALKTRSAAATNSAGLIFFPLLFLTPNFVPRDLLTRPMEIAATINPVTYLMEALRSLILEDLAWETILLGFLVVGVAGAIMLAVSVRVIRNVRLDAAAATTWSACGQGKLTMLTGTVAEPCAAAPVSLTTWSMVPTPPSETVRRSCSFTPGVTGTSNARVAWIEGSTLKKQ